MLAIALLVGGVLHVVLTPSRSGSARCIRSRARRVRAASTSSEGVQLAVQLVNADGGVGGRPVELVPVDIPSADAAPGAIARLDDDGVRLVLGSYGSTISAPAAEAAAAPRTCCSGRPARSAR